MNNQEGQILEETKYFDGAIFDVVSRKVKTPDGLTVNRDVVVHGDAVAMIMPVQKNGHTEYVVGTEFRAGINQMRTSIPAGLMNKGETPKQAAIREAMEENGLEYANAEEIFLVSTSEGFTNEQTHLMLLSDFKGTVEKHFDESENIVTNTMTLEELGKAVKNQEITTAPAIIAYQYLVLNE